MGTYRSYSLGLQELLKPTLSDSMVLKALYVNVTETSEEARTLGCKTEAGCSTKAQGRYPAKDLEVCPGILETSR